MVAPDPRALRRNPFPPSTRTTPAAPLDESRRILRWGLRSYGDEILLASSLGPQSLVILDLLHHDGLKVRTVMLDTGQLFEETLRLKDRVETHFGISIESVRPDANRVQNEDPLALLWQGAPDQCCAMRKVEPLRQVLSGARAWITGIRRDHSQTRSQARTVEWDGKFGLVKVNPLISWTRDQVMTYLDQRGIPVNPLLHEGYPSIGCQPCTSKVSPERMLLDERAGRWASSGKTECGLHRSDRAM